MSVELEIRNDHVVASYHGEVSLEDISAARTRILASIAEHGMTRLLVDIRGRTNAIPAADLRASMQSTSSVTPPRPITALLGRPDQRGELELIESLAIGRGLPIRGFTDEAAALEWLLH